MAQWREEFEIKLRGAPADISALRRSGLLESLGAGKAGIERLVSTYYDTSDRAIAAAGVSLRLRRKAGGLIQAVKAKSKEGGIIARAEAEQALASEAEFPAAREADALADLINGRGEIAPVARTVADRWTAIVNKSGARIEAAFDFGRAEAWRDGGPVAFGSLAETELELVDGRPEALFEVARLCLKEGAGRLRLAGASQEEEARRLVEGGPWLGPEPALRLKAKASAGDVLAAALMSAALRLIDIAPAITELRLPEGAHQMRVALRRLQAIEKVFRSAVDDKRLRKLVRRARRFADVLGTARDWDVFLETTLPAVRSRPMQPDGFGVLEARAEALRAKAWDKAARVIGGVDFNLFVLDLLAAARLQKWRKGAARALDDRADILAAAALEERLDEARRVASGVDALEPAARHPLRIALKKLRYAAQTFRPLYPRDERKAYMAAMARLQDMFGALNDAVVAQELSSRAAKGQGRAAARAAGFICGFRAAEAEAASRAIGEIWAAFAAMNPFWRSAPIDLHTEKSPLA